MAHKKGAGSSRNGRESESKIDPIFLRGEELADSAQPDGRPRERGIPGDRKRPHLVCNDRWESKIHQEKGQQILRLH